jgi:hypothetical protein
LIIASPHLFPAIEDDANHRTGAPRNLAQCTTRLSEDGPHLISPVEEIIVELVSTPVGSLN